MPLQVIIVGAGIGGLSAAVALRQAGHYVKVFEKSQFASEVGAAVALTPNGTRVLDHLGFDWARARADAMVSFEVVDGVTLTGLHRADTSDARTRFGAAFWTIHRVDLHNELMRLAASPNAAGDGTYALRLGARVVSVDPARGCVVLEDGSQHVADLVVGADGLRSVVRSVVLGSDRAGSEPTPSGMNAFRFMIPTAELVDDPAFQELMRVKGRGNSVFADPSNKTERHMVWYTCRGGTMQNFGGIHERSSDKNATAGVDVKSMMLSEFGHFHPNLVELMRKADRVTDWPLNYHDPLPTFVRGKVALMGDAAHPMLPFGAQGSNQAIEDAGALGELFHGVDSPALVPERLAMFDSVRRLRASRVQTLSRVRLGKEMQVQAQLRQYADPAGRDVPASFVERQVHDYG
ncbi:putative salicylate hydroxylase [Lasiosphaeria ovina]|uniref:Salicylate hydroxylase n=1 Tax=Lasiosphaeria ovina TaxID=92902 RepID=A0AAE0JSI5_9PEZI|nr:putative salicylate hydroxylase [Lasiosphaeria ovina]